MTTDPHAWPAPTADTLRAGLLATSKADDADRFARLLARRPELAAISLAAEVREHTAESDACGAEGWTHDDGEVVCDLTPGHDGPHVDSWEGWEWPSPRPIPSAKTEVAS
jgi:hypothetical protein